jgi:flagellar biosynthesis protein FlhF
MKIQRYSAVSMRAALAQVRAEQGPDAVILSSRRGPEGIEVIAAMDYDEALFMEANRPRSPEAAAPPATPAAATAPIPPARSAATAAAAARIAVPSPRAETPPAHAATRAPVLPARTATPTAHAVTPMARAATSRPEAPELLARDAVPQTRAAVPLTGNPVRAARAPLPTARGAAAPARTLAPKARAAPAGPRSADAADAGIGSMQRELKDLRQLMETGLAGMTWNDRRLRDPLRAQVLEDLSAIDIAPDVALALAELAPRRTSLQNIAHIPPALLVKHLPVVGGLSNVEGGVIAVVGPTGAGKTTTIAKLAAHWCMQHGSDDLAVVSTDAYRIGARDQLMAYARILGAPLYAIDSGKELGRVLARLKDKKLVLIDTAGMGPRDVRLTEQLAVLQSGAPGARVLLALPAQGEGHALDEIVRAFRPLNPAACVLTKVDEAASLGAALSTALRHRLKIAYVCDGQRVPEDLHPAHLRRVWLARAAFKLKKPNPTARDAAYLGRNFGRAPAHA